MYDTDPQVTELIDTALKVEGMPRHASTHAAGVVITPEPTDYYLPLATNDGLPVTQFNMTEIEELGLLKMDFLGLRTLTVIRDAEIAVQKHDPEFSVQKLDYDDPDTYRMLGQGDTEGVFQLESSGMKQVLVGLQPQNLEDIIALISLYRPGPMDSIPTYLRNRHEPDKISYKTPQLAHILDVTNGCIVYQEQVMQIFRELAGFFIRAGRQCPPCHEQKRSMLSWRQSVSTLCTAAPTPATNARAVWQTAFRKKWQTRSTTKCPALPPMHSTKPRCLLCLCGISDSLSQVPLPQRIHGCIADQRAGQHR